MFFHTLADASFLNLLLYKFKFMNNWKALEIWHHAKQWIDVPCSV